MLSLEEALEKLFSSAPPIAGAEMRPLDESIGRFLASDIFAKSALPPFDNSAMDGYAVKSEDVRGASSEKPIRLRNIANIPAGSFFSGEIKVGECARIFTGSPLPAGADSVVMQEDTRAAGSEIEILDAVKPWENIRFRGEDIKEGARIAVEGSRINAQIASLLSACGIAAVLVQPQLKISILATGNELRPPGHPLAPGEIYESNRILISSLVRALGFEPIVRDVVPDDLSATMEAIRNAATSDAIITCGGVSVGEFDFVKSAITELGGSIDFWRVAIKPGKPFAHATVLDKPLFGLPGNPVSALVTFWLLVRPTLLKMAGAVETTPTISLGELAEEFSNPGDRRHFVRVSIGSEGKVRASGPQASHRLGSLAAANGLLDMPAGAKWEKGKTVKVILLP
jgi:molybdopterin molybdotransferase